MSCPVPARAAHDFYVDALDILIASRVPFVVGGAYAFACHTGIARDTKDLDVFVHADDVERVLRLFADAGYRTDLTFPHWLGKVHGEDGVVLDVIFGSGNGCAPVDDAWFAHAVDGEVLGRCVKLSPPEEMIWSKAFIMERERYDGADVAHLIRARGRSMDWKRLVARFGAHWRVLLSHLILFGFVYPAERDAIPAAVMRRLLRRLDAESGATPSGERLCAGTLLSRSQYLVDIDRWGYADARRQLGIMSDEDIAGWTAAIDDAPRAA
jgi:hypothetical protein